MGPTFSRRGGPTFSKAGITCDFPVGGLDPLSPSGSAHDLHLSRSTSTLYVDPRI